MITSETSRYRMPLLNLVKTRQDLIWYTLHSYLAQTAALLRSLILVLTQCKVLLNWQTHTPGSPNSLSLSFPFLKSFLVLVHSSQLLLLTLLLCSCSLTLLCSYNPVCSLSFSYSVSPLFPILCLMIKSLNLCIPSLSLFFFLDLCSLLACILPQKSSILFLPFLIH
jgi:hypothetical protein